MPKFFIRSSAVVLEGRSVSEAGVRTVHAAPRFRSHASSLQQRFSAVLCCFASLYNLTDITAPPFLFRHSPPQISSTTYTGTNHAQVPTRSICREALSSLSECRPSCSPAPPSSWALSHLRATERSISPSQSGRRGRHPARPLPGRVSSHRDLARQ